MLGYLGRFLGLLSEFEGYMNRELNDKAEKFASQWCLKNED